MAKRCIREAGAHRRDAWCRGQARRDGKSAPIPKRNIGSYVGKISSAFIYHGG